jgi:hypothetical protein
VRSSGQLNGVFTPLRLFACSVRCPPSNEVKKQRDEILARFSIAGLMVIVFLSVLFNSCSTSVRINQPEWFKTGKHPEYPESFFMLGAGASTTKGDPDRAAKEADDMARAEIAKQIQVNIEQSFDSEVSEKVAGRNEKEFREFLSHSKLRTKSRVDLELSGVEIAERWNDPKRDVYYSLAVLDRGKAAAGLKTEITMLIKAVSSYQAMAEKSAFDGDYEVALRRLSTARQMAADAEVKTAQLAIINRERPSWGGVVTSKDLQAKIEELQKKLKFAVKVFETIEGSRSESDHVAPMIISAIRECGLEVVSWEEGLPSYDYDQLKKLKPEELQRYLPESVRYLILAIAEARLSSSSMYGQTKVYFFQSRGEITLIDFKKGKYVLDEVIGFSDITKIGSPSNLRAASDSLLKVGRIFKEVLSKKVRDIFFAEE